MDIVIVKKRKPKGNAECSWTIDISYYFNSSKSKTTAVFWTAVV
jgi:hypothetical protein